MPKPTTTKSVIYVGVDPGMKGGLVSIFGNDVRATPMPETERDVWDWFDAVPPFATAMIESVHSMPKQGVASSFTFGKGYGGLRMALTAARIPFETADPRTWQKFLGIPPRKKTESKLQFKSRLRAFAQRFFPRLEIWTWGKGKQLAVCDALLLALYCQRKSEGKL